MATLSTDKIEATVVAVNDDGASLPSRVLIPLRWTEKEPIAVSRAVYTNGGFPISWERDDNNGTCEYVVEWYNASCRKDCSVDWIKVATLNNFSVRSEPPQLLQRLQGYMQELARQQDSNILLTWEEIPLANRRGFLLGYNVYVNNDSSLTLIEAGPSGGLAPSLGSPTSVASTQFLLPDGDEHAEEKHQQSSAASWFTNLLSTTKP
ncbi:unnamed protein product [Tetraodon nigroviridis]|uniref:(spotted green pufferfish) hypothetical protein n=1 Tax=Tetraodon nigroviridis TaxID=99883 RepID=Q4RPS1_TETNG|nr:unnamed protein product [Tetraodon nigroviridis]